MQLEKLLSKQIPVFLAPMAGVTDAPFRSLVKRFGATAVVSEMVSSEALVRSNQKTQKRLVNDSGGLNFIQIVGADPSKMAESARINEAGGADVIDINMGCPVKKIINSEAGSALMRDEAVAIKIVESVVKAVSIPVTVKMRLGWDSEHKNCIKLAKAFEDVGARMVTIHCRTRNQMYSGTANWNEIFALRDEIKIPYLCNGDIKTCSDAKTALDQSRANGIMIGRAALGRPWILNQILCFLNKVPIPEAPSTEKQLDIVMEHFHNTLDFYGKEFGYRIFRKHFCWYSAGMKGAAHFRETINKMDDIKAIETFVKNFYAESL